jgi:hypothetical protein
MGQWPNKAILAAQLQTTFFWFAAHGGGGAAAGIPLPPLTAGGAVAISFYYVFAY